MATPRPGKPLTWKPRGLSDAVDGTNAFPGAMTLLTNLIPAPSTTSLYVPRPAAVQLTPFNSFNTPTAGTELLVIGDIAYGMISSGAFPGKDEPFKYNLLTGTFTTITGTATANLPTTQSTTGDWTPPTMAAIGGRIVVTHPGFGSGAVKFGWIDISSFTSTAITGTTNATTTIAALSSSPIVAGWQPGMTITGAGIPANTTVVSFTATTVVLSQAATGAAAGVALSVSGGTPAAPQWGAGDTNTNNLTAKPVAVSQLNGRAYYAVDTGVQCSDPGFACQITNATQALTFRNGINVTALAPQSFTSTTTGGAVQSLLAFQGSAGIMQITGDPAGTTPTLTYNALNSAVGTLAPNGICPTPLGTMFIAPDGVRLIDRLGQVSDPIGGHGQGVTVPFLYALYPSRISAAFNRNVLRVTVQNGNATGQPYQEYWLDFTDRTWSGPHTLPCALIAAWQGTSNTFVCFPSPSLQTVFTPPSIWGAFTWGAALWGGTPVAGVLFQSDVQPSNTSVYRELGAAMSFVYETVLLPDNEEMSANQMIEASLGVSLPATAGQITVTVLNEASTVLDTLTLQGTGTAATLWGAFAWGAATWGGGTGYFVQASLNWHVPIVFKQMGVKITGTAVANLALGNLYMKYRPLGYPIFGVA